MVEDPSNQYIYTSNGDGTVTGKVLDNTTGKLSNLSSRVDLYDGRTGDMPCSKRQRRLAGRIAAGETRDRMSRRILSIGTTRAGGNDLPRSQASMKWNKLGRGTLASILSLALVSVTACSRDYVLAYVYVTTAKTPDDFVTGWGRERVCGGLSDWFADAAGGFPDSGRTKSGHSGGFRRTG